MTPVLSKTLNATKSIATLAKEPIKRLFCERCLVADGIILVVLLCLFGALYLQVLDIHVWHHDALVMFSDYMGKLRAEGRWLNYIFFPFLSERAIIPSISATRLNFRWLLNFMPTETRTASIKATFTS